MRASVRSALGLALLAFGVSLPAGCGKSAPEPATTVRGRVTFQGRPVAGGVVVFAPDPDRGATGKPAHAETGPDGTYDLTPGPRGDVPPGWYRVSIAAAPGDPAAAGFPAELARPDRSGLVREVKAGQANVFEFGVEVTP